MKLLEISKQIESFIDYYVELLFGDYFGLTFGLIILLIVFSAVGWFIWSVIEKLH